jgi:hypothetical protein
MRWCFLVLAACTPPTGQTGYYPAPPAGSLPPASPAAARVDPSQIGQLVDRMTDFAFDGGHIEFEIRRDGQHVIELARNYYAVPIVMRWELGDLENLQPDVAPDGVTLLPAATAPDTAGAPVILATLAIPDLTKAYHRKLHFHARFGDPRAEATPYAYRLPFARDAFSVLQGFHGTFSHRGSNEYAVDFDCPVATHVVAARPGIVVASNAAAQGSGTTPEFLEYRRTNFVLVLHEDGTLGEYMHLSPSGVLVRPGERVERGRELALSGNTGFSSVPHLHFQVMTAADDGIAARSFPFDLAVAPKRTEAPVQGHTYRAWE